MPYSAIADDVLVAADAVDGGVEIFVFDSGPGVEIERVESLFDCFARAEDGRGGNGGAGLGLAIVRAVAAAHGGRVGVRADRRGRGSVWSLWLPRCAASSTMLASAPATRELVVGAAASTAGAR